MPTDEQIAKILYWVMLAAPTPREVRDAFDEVFNLDDWIAVTGRRNPAIRCLVWQHNPVLRKGVTQFAASEEATWYVTELGVAWLKAYEERQHDTE